MQKVLPGLDLQEARKVSGQLLNLADGVWNAHSSTVPGEAESMTLLVLNEETALRKVEAEYKASRPGYLVFLVDGYDDVFSDMLDSERARLLEGINRVLEDMIGRGTGFLRRVASGRYIAVVEERQMEQFANRGYDVLDKLYDDNDLNCDNFAHAVREYRCSREVITAVSNLYLRQQIMLDTY